MIIILKYMYELIFVKVCVLEDNILIFQLIELLIVIGGYYCDGCFYEMFVNVNKISFKK